MKTPKTFSRPFTLSAIALALGLSVAGQAHAEFISCTGTGYDISGKVSTATACTILAPLNGSQNDNPMPGVVNTESFFGITDWLFDGKWDSSKSGFVDSSGLFDFGGNGVSGTFNYVGPNSIGDIMFIFKDGAGTNLVGYLMTADDGTYATPFTKLPFPLTGGSLVKDVSHISVYYRNGDGDGDGGGGTPPSQIPEPGMLLLLGAGLAGLGLARRRK